MPAQDVLPPSAINLGSQVCTVILYFPLSARHKQPYGKMLALIQAVLLIKKYIHTYLPPGVLIGGVVISHACPCVREKSPMETSREQLFRVPTRGDQSSVISHTADANQQ